MKEKNPTYHYTFIALHVGNSIVRKETKIWKKKNVQQGIQYMYNFLCMVIQYGCTLFIKKFFPRFQITLINSKERQIITRVA